VAVVVSGIVKVHFAYRVISPVTGVEKLYVVVRPGSLYQPPKVKPSQVGLGGLVAVLP